MDLFPLRSRLRNIFGQAGDEDNSLTRNSFPIPKPQATTQVNKSALDEPDDINTTKMLMDAYNEPSPAVSRLNQYVSSAPDRSKYEPSTKRKIAAALAGFAVGLTDPKSGANLNRTLLDKPFDDAVEDWKRKGVPIVNAAKAEAQSRTQRITALKDISASKRADTLANSEINARKATAQHYGNVDAETLARDQANEAELARTHKETEGIRRETNLRETNRDTETTRHNKEIEGIAKTNAASTATRSKAYVSSVEGLNAYRDHLKEQLRTTGKGPAAQKVAKELATADTVLKPGNSQRYSDFYHHDEKGKIVIDPPSKGMFTSDEDFQGQMLEYSKFIKEIDDTTQSHLNENGYKVAPPKKDDTTKKPKAIVVGRERG